MRLTLKQLPRERWIVLANRKSKAVESGPPEFATAIATCQIEWVVDRHRSTGLSLGTTPGLGCISGDDGRTLLG